MENNIIDATDNKTFVNGTKIQSSCLKDLLIICNKVKNVRIKIFMSNTQLALKSVNKIFAFSHQRLIFITHNYLQCFRNNCKNE